MRTGDVPQMTLLGFDAREEYLGSWDQARRERYLLVCDVPKPYSVDVLVWPSIFGDGMGEQQQVEAGPKLRLTSTWRGPNAPLWEDLGVLQEAIAEAPRQQYTLVAVSEVNVNPSLGEPPEIAGLAPARSPAALNDGWSLLGYDVADRYFISGLTNCGYEPDETRRVAAQRWSARLNAHHLFDEAADASRFSAEVALRVPEHAPFFVFALHAVSDARQSAP